MANVEGTSNSDRIDSIYVDDEGDSVGEANDFVRGFEGSDTIFGLGGADILDGGLGNDLLFGNDGHDNLFGGAGDDNLSGSFGGDQLNGGDGIDTAFYDGSGNVSVDLLFGSALSGHADGDTLFGIENLTGSAFDDALKGDNDANKLVGGAGNDFLEGRGGADLIIGGAGVDTASWISSASGVMVSLYTSQGDGDLLGEIENLLGSKFGDTLTGDNNANILDGDAGDDILIGGGGSDVMFGVTGNDTYREVDGSDIVDEGIGDGVDTVEALVSFSLVNSAQVVGAIENLILLGTANINGTGNALANTIIGNTAANILDGGAGADTLRGLGGSDNYIVDNAGDVVDETAPGSNGSDTVFASVSFALADGVENLALTGTALNGTGNALANVITGNGGANRINGGAGIDTLTGGAGPDTFFFDAAIEPKASATANADTITDFNPIDDTIELTKTVFPKLKVGALKNKAFGSDKKNPAKDKHLIYYDEKNGDLWYDANGGKQKGKGDVLIATLDTNLDLTAADIVVA